MNRFRAARDALLVKQNSTPSRPVRLVLLLWLLALPASPARAQVIFQPDVQISGFAVALRQNGVIVPIPAGGDPIPFFPSDSLQGAFQIAATLDTPTGAANGAFDIEVAVVSLDCDNGCSEQGRLVIGTERLQGAGEIGSRNPPQPAPVSFQMQFDGLAFSFFAFAAANAGNDLRFEVTVDSSDEISEMFEGNNTALAPAIVNLVPVGALGAIRIGPIDLAPLAVDLAPNPGACGGANPVWISSATGTWEQPAGSGAFESAVVTVVPNCGNLLPSAVGNLFALVAPSGTAGDIAGVFGGHEVVAEDVFLNGSGALPLIVRVTLPPGHSLHDSDLGGTPRPRGDVTAALGSFPSGRVADLDDLVATGETGRLLHPRELPLHLPLVGLSLSQAGFGGLYGTPRYAYDLPFALDDLRHRTRRGVISNDRRFAEATPVLGAPFSIGPDGVVATLGYDATAGPLHYPRVSAAWGGFEVAIDDGRIAPGQTLSSAGYYRFRQSPQCEDCPPVGGPEPLFDLDPDTAQGQAPDGALVAHFAQVGANPVWGPWDAGLELNVFERRDDDVQPGVLYVPGFIATGSGGAADRSVSESLLGMRAADLVDDALLPGPLALLTETASRRGNGFGAGLTIGPRWLVGPGDGLPQAGPGALLAQTDLRIGFNGLGGTIPPQFVNVTTNEGTKLLVRPAGVTGVFNTTEPPQPDLAGYDSALHRFAFRQENNVLDPYTWIDGVVGVPLPGDFEIAFSSLELLCTGDVASGVVDREDCDDLLPDTNGNGLEDENCNERLGAWQANLDELISMRFVPEDPEAGICDAGDRVLEVGSSVDVRALDEPIGLISQWRPDGEPQNSRITGETERVFDAPADDESEGTGFDVALGHQIELAHKNDSSGWFLVPGASVPFPVWEAAHVGIRFQNETPELAAQTVVGPTDAAFILAGDQDNADVLPAMEGDDGRIEARYVWANTGFEFAKDVRYQPGRQPFFPPRFVGESEDQSLIVLTTHGAIDYIDPDATKASLGVSAQLGADALIGELSSTSGLAGALADAGLLPDLGVLDGVRAAADQLAAISGSGFGGFLAEGLRDHLDASIGSGAGANAPLPEIAAALTEVNALPARFLAEVSGPLEEELRDLSGALAPSLDATVLDIENTLPGLLIDALEPAPDPVALAAMLAYRDHLDTLEQALTATRRTPVQLNEIYKRIETALQALEIGQGTIARATDAADSLDDLLSGGLGLPGCGPEHPVLQRVAQLGDTLHTTRDVLGAIDLAGVGALFDQLEDVDTTALEAATQDIADLLEDVQARLDEILPVVDALTGCDIGSLVDYAQLGDTELAQQLEATRDELLEVENRIALTSLFASFGENSAINGVQEALGQAMQGVDEQLAVVQKLKIWIDLAQGGVDNYNGRTTVPEIHDYLDDMAFAPGGEPFTARLRDALAEPVQQALGVATFFGKLTPVLGLNSLIGENHTPDTLLAAFVDGLLDDEQIEIVENTTFEHLDEMAERVSSIDTLLMDQINALIRALAQAGGGTLADLLEDATAPVGAETDWNLVGASLDGYVLFRGDDMERLHVDAGFQVAGDEEGSGFEFGAGLDVSRWTANGKDQGCPGVLDAEARMDVLIEARNLPFYLGPSRARIRRVGVGFTLEEQGGVPLPVAAAGGLEIEGALGAQSFKILDPAFAMGVGDVETYVGAAALGIFDRVAIDIAFLVGQTCNLDVLHTLDEQSEEFIGDLLDGAFRGAYVRGGLSSVIWDNGCLLQLGVGVDVGNWIIVPGGGNPVVIGGRFGGGIFGKGACLVSIRGGAGLAFSFAYPEVHMAGDMFIVGGLGICTPAGWTSVSASRSDDPLCGTVDASIGASATLDLEELLGGNPSGFSYDIDPPSFGAIH